jgi:RNA 2',3'-cyclic 3'-phosphodiesterase
VNDLPDRIRAFVAIQLDAKVEDAVAEFIETMQASSHGVRWTRRANLHLTLRFLGDAARADQLERLNRGLEQIAAATEPFVLEVRGTGVFPNPGRPRVVWIGLESNALTDLAGRIEAVTVASGFPPERRNFSPHLTIGRVRDPRGWLEVRDTIGNAAERVFGATRVASLALYRSTPGRETSIYTELARHALHRTG